MPMAARRDAAVVFDEWAPYLMSPSLGRISVARSAIMVDLPAPFGPSSPRIMPRPARKETRESARRRPKWRATFSAVTWSKSMVNGLGGGALPASARTRLVKLSVDLLEVRDESLLAGRLLHRFAVAAANALFDARQFAEQRVPARHQARTRFARSGCARERKPESTQPNRDCDTECDIPGSRAVDGQ